ncbi:membrane-bound PQQ-dependent dehydrogenase, glucose/quinate/shikimate family [Altererythrobacter sp.]|nr:membrane-bound PQQ-dependent dehydrogenase, glucose/quinate/shikimate family [Altererythrobacter sp.]
MSEIDEAESRSGVSITARLLALLLGLVGLVLALGGTYLAVLGGSLYYVLAGLGLLASAFFLFKGRFLGAIIYSVTFLATLVWAIWETDNSAWEFVPRLVGPGILFLMVLWVAPKLAGTRLTRPASLMAMAGVVVGLSALFIAYGSGPYTGSFDYPDERMAMGDPSLMQTGSEWPAYGGSYASRRFSPLNQINLDNIDELERAWVFRTGDMPEDLAHNKYGAETTPLMVGDTLYLCSAKNIIIAVDPGTGEEKWRHNPGVSDDFIPYTAACRGVSYFDRNSASANGPSIGDDGSPTALPVAGPAGARPTIGQAPAADLNGALANPEGNAGGSQAGSVPEPAPGNACDARIIEGTLDGRIIAVDAKTGMPCADFGANGEVRITIGMGQVDPGMVAITSPPVIVNGVIVTGHQVKDNVNREAPSGVIQGFDAITGEHLWAWDMNRPEQTGRPQGDDVFSRGTPNMWTIASGDDELGLVYLPMGNAAADYVSSHRTEAELTYSAALVAIDARSGEPRWHFRTIDNDVWDYDLGSQATLLDFPTDDGLRPALILPSKQGDLYILDRATGEPLTGIERRPVPQGGAEPELRTDTQPFSTYHTLARPDLRERDMWGMSLIDQMICRIQFRQASYDGMYTPPEVDQYSIQYPSYNGGSDWGGVSVDPQRGIIIANYNDMPNYVRLIPPDEREEIMAEQELADEKPSLKSSGGSHALAPMEGADYGVDVNAGWRLPWTGLLCKEPPYGGIRAIDLVSGETIWDRPFGTARKNGPWGLSFYLPFNVGTPNNGGPLLTEGGLIFAGATTDDLFRAIDARTGETIWSDVLPAGGQANPMTYEYEGRQYVVMMAGGHHFMQTKIGDELVAYALPTEDGE